MHSSTPRIVVYMAASLDLHFYGHGWFQLTVGGHAGDMWGAHRNGVFAVRNVTIAEPQTDVRVEADCLNTTKIHNSRSVVAKSTPEPFRNLPSVSRGKRYELQLLKYRELFDCSTTPRIVK